MVRDLRRWLASIVLFSVLSLWLVMESAPALASPIPPENPSKAAFDVGVKAYQSGQFAEAVQAFTEAIEIDSRL